MTDLFILPCRLLYGFILCLLLMGSTDAMGATLRVGPSERYTTIQAGIDAAVDGDTVVVKAGVYKEEGNAGLLFKGKAITLRSEDGPGKCIIDGRQEQKLDPDPEDTSTSWVSIVTFANNETASSVLSGFTIRNGPIGGVKCIHSSPTIRNCIITGNSATGTYYGAGGGIFAMDASPTIENCVLSENVAIWGGGISCYRSSPRIANCTFSRNYAYHSGGAIYVFDVCSPKIVNSIIKKNQAVVYGGAVYSKWASSPVITNCTILKNTSSAGGVIYSDLKSFPRVANSIFWGNHSPSAVAAGEGRYSVTYSNLPGGEGNNIDADPGFVDPRLADYHLKMGSPCIDVGDNNALELPLIDMDGNARIWPRGGRVDMGAFEFHK